MAEFTDQEVEKMIVECSSEKLSENTVREMRVLIKSLIVQENKRCHSLMQEAVGKLLNF